MGPLMRNSLDANPPTFRSLISETLTPSFRGPPVDGPASEAYRLSVISITLSEGVPNMYRSAFCALASVAVLASFTTTGFAIQLGPGSPEPPAGWLPRVVEQITKGQYGFSSVGAGVFLARNKAQGLEVRLDARGIELALRGHPADGWKETLRVWGFGREGAIAPVGQAVPRVDGNRAELRRDEMTEWYINRTGGIEQGFTITAPASGDAARPLVIEIRLSGDLDTRADGSPSVVFSTRRAQPVLHYGA